MLVKKNKTKLGIKKTNIKKHTNNKTKRIVKKRNITKKSKKKIYKSKPKKRLIKKTKIKRNKSMKGGNDICKVEKYLEELNKLFIDRNKKANKKQKLKKKQNKKDKLSDEIKQIDEEIKLINSNFAKCSIPEKGIEVSLNIPTIPPEAFLNCKFITSVILGDEVETISHGAFNGCSEIKTLTLGSNITTIGSERYSSGAFQGCVNLTEIIIPDSVTTIGSYAFSECTNLTSIALSESTNIETIDEYAFYRCSQLVSLTGASNTNGVIVIPSTIISIGNGAFDGCMGFTQITIPGTVLSIGSMAFIRCDNITKVVIEKTTEGKDFEFKDFVFKNLPKLTEVDISCKSIGDGAFYNCSNLISLNLREGVEEIKDGGILEKKTIHEIRRFRTGAFTLCTTLTKVVIPSTLKIIGNNAFFQCADLKLVEGGTQVTRIGHRAFAECIKLENFFKLPETLKVIGIKAFKECANILFASHVTNVLIPKSVEEVGLMAFQNSNVKTVYLFRVKKNRIIETQSEKKIIYLTDKFYPNIKKSLSELGLTYTYSFTEKI